MPTTITNANGFYCRWRTRRGWRIVLAPNVNGCQLYRQRTLYQPHCGYVDRNSTSASLQRFWRQHSDSRRKLGLGCVQRSSRAVPAGGNRPGPHRDHGDVDFTAKAFTRKLLQPTEIADIDIPAGSRVLVLYASANRDEQEWTDPDVFDIRRNATRHLGFGYGTHACAGQGLARLEMQAMLTALTRQVSRIELAGEPTWALNNIFRCYERLPLRLISAERSQRFLRQRENFLPASALGPGRW